MASSAQNHQQHFPATSAPPPTPSITSTSTSTSTSDSAVTDLLSRLLHRLPPTLSDTPILLRRRSLLAATTTSPLVISFPDLNSSLSSTLTSVSESGFFQLTNHSIPSELARSAESDSLSLFNLPRHQKHQHFPRSWPLGFDADDEDDTGAGESLFLDSFCSTDSSELSLNSLREFTQEMEKIGLAVVEALSCAMGLQNPARYDPSSVCSLMWISDSSSSPGDTMAGSGKLYPYVVGLHYQIRSQKCSLLADSGSVSISTQMDSILVTLGDIAQVWSNGKLSKVKGKPILSMEESTSVTMSLLVTLPVESTVSVLSRVLTRGHGDTDTECNVNQNQDHYGETSEESKFSSFSFEDYAWNVYHDRLSLKDSLHRYRIQTQL
ncbi:gibberellin 2-beta-dioxygenase 4 [Cynara cardunculus var. scolymus]|uniref:Non-heme dioxygenase N-terminal domain-containing protein n=1 Tax=Cynara cardunculus var. scolymus TaxID=59895 RepID=A0A124SG02_CYNCS|nr:gibberellin 2-beta-dioxygenase 4 [Cynara cardunculus var. scolymus]KVI04843.1 Non-heme dioxygenase N-terminal domain-containing protein [Cynara cardunculus var. scolymus]